MNTPHDPLEEELRGLQPAMPSLRLASRLAADLAASPATSTAPRRRRIALRDVSLWLSWGVAAAMTVAYFTRTPPVPAAPTGQETPAAIAAAQSPSATTADSPARFKPVSATNTLISALDEGVVFLEDGQPARKVRYEFLDTVDLRSTDDSRATIAVTTPREEIRLVPVQTY
jgi:hypothetical protein